MKKYQVRVIVQVLADDREDAIIEAKNTIYNGTEDMKFVVYHKLKIVEDRETL